MTRATRTRTHPGAIARLLRRVALLLLAVSMACASDRPLPEIVVPTGPDAEITVDGLYRAKGSAFAMLWLKPDADFDVYRSLQLDPVQVAYRRKPTSRSYSATGNNFALSPSQMERFKRYFHDAMVNAIEASPDYTLTEEPGPDVLRIEAAIIDLQIEVPTDPSPTDRVYSTSTGAMTLILELRDSLSGEVLARIADRKAARAPGQGLNTLQWSNAASNSAAVKAVFRGWAKILMARLDEVHAIEPTAPPAE